LQFLFFQWGENESLGIWFASGHKDYISLRWRENGALVELKLA
jgi:hypothetical protein